MRFVLAHEVPGRIRLRAPRGFGSATAQTVHDALSAVGGVTVSRVNPRTGSVLCLYGGDGARRALLEALGVDDRRDIRARHAASPSSPASPASGLHPARVSPPSPVFLRTGGKGEARPERKAGRAREEGCSGSSREPAPSGGRADSPFLPVALYFLLRAVLPRPLNSFNAFRRAVPFLRKGWRALRRGRVNVDVLDASALFISLARSDFPTAGLLSALLALGVALEDWTRKKSLDSLAESLALHIDAVWLRWREGGRTRDVSVPLSEVRKGDWVVVRAGAAIPVDGVVVEGEAVVNQASMTGEALGVPRFPGSSVFAGTVLEEGSLIVRVAEVGGQTRLHKILRFIEESEALKADVQGQAERMADAVVPFSFLLFAMVGLVTRDMARAASVLLVDYSCALRLATPLAILSAMRQGASRGLLIKGGRFLEGLARADTVIFDKTGTLTESRPQVTEVVPFPLRKREALSRDDVLRLAACLEEHFPHPVARAVVRQAEKEGLRHSEEHAEVEYVVAHGVASRVHGKRVLVGSRHYLETDENVDLRSAAETARDLAAAGRSLLYLALDGELAGLVALEDPLRPEAPALLEALRRRGLTAIMLTGDDERTAAAVAARLGIGDYRAQVMPEDKAALIRSLQDEGRIVAMVGDGVNDSPALSAADVGISLRDGADLAREVAGVVLACGGRTDGTASGRGLMGLLEALDLARGAMGRIRANFRLTIALNSVFMALGLTGLIPPATSAILHNSTTIGVALNAMRSLPAESGYSGIPAKDGPA